MLRDARALGPDAAYEARQDETAAQYRADLLIAWLNTPTWQASQNFAAANSDALLDPATQAILDTFASSNLRDPTLRLHRGLLSYAATTSFDTAYELRTDTAQQASIPGNPDIPADTRLALARLHSGQATDDPEATSTSPPQPCSPATQTRPQPPSPTAPTTQHPTRNATSPAASANSPPSTPRWPRSSQNSSRSSPPTRLCPPLN